MERTGAAAAITAVAAAILVTTITVACTSDGGSSAARPPTTATEPTTTTEPPVAWQPWTAPDGTFRIEFPGTPTLEDVPVSEPNLQRATQADADVGDTGYQVSWFDLVPGFFYRGADADAVLTTGVDTFGSGVSLTFTRHDLGDFAGNPALHFAGTGQGGHELEGVAVISGTRLYLFVAGSPPGSPRDFDRFLSSFRIL